MTYCKFGNFGESFIFRETLRMQSFEKIKPSRNGENTLSFTGVVQSCQCREFLRGKYFVTLFAKIKLS